MPEPEQSAQGKEQVTLQVLLTQATVPLLPGLGQSESTQQVPVAQVWLQQSCPLLQSLVAQQVPVTQAFPQQTWPDEQSVPEIQATQTPFWQTFPPTVLHGFPVVGAQEPSKLVTLHAWQSSHEPCVQHTPSTQFPV